MKCRHCGQPLTLPLIDLGTSPPSNAYVDSKSLQKPEQWFPLRVLVCERCWLVQTEDFAKADALFDSDYAYFSSFSSTWLAHSEQYVSGVVERFGLGPSSHMVEVAANDGYLLQFAHARRIPCTGIEPTASTAAAARAKGIPIIEDFFGSTLAADIAAQGRQADITVANNVLAHVPDINDFVTGFRHLLKPQGVATFEFPHLVRLIAENQFDTIYHEHFSYLSLTAVESIFAANGLALFDVEELTTHGGSLRVYAQRRDSGTQPVDPSVARLLKHERDIGVNTSAYYAGMQAKTNRIKDDFLAFLIDARRNGYTIAAYGAAAKGNTLVNYAGMKHDIISFVADRNPAKQGKYLPGSRIPIVSEEHLRHDKPDYVILFPWNLRHELTAQLDYVREWGARFVIAVPHLEVL